jgi:hypothetical protein
MATEDGQYLGLLLSILKPTSSSTNRLTLYDILKLYESTRKARTTCIVKQPSHQHQIFRMHDSPRQEERDRQLTEYDHAPFEGYPNKCKDPEFQE